MSCFRCVTSWWCQSASFTYFHACNGVRQVFRSVGTGPRGPRAQPERSRWMPDGALVGRRTQVQECGHAYKSGAMFSGSPRPAHIGDFLPPTVLMLRPEALITAPTLGCRGLGVCLVTQPNAPPKTTQSATETTQGPTRHTAHHPEIHPAPHPAHQSAGPATSRSPGAGAQRNSDPAMTEAPAPRTPQDDDRSAGNLPGGRGARVPATAKGSPRWDATSAG